MAQAAVAKKPVKVVKATKEFTFVWEGTDRKGARIKGNSIDPASTLNVIDWNLNWFGTPDPTLGPTDKALQKQNVGTILPSLHADLYALEDDGKLDPLLGAPSGDTAAGSA